MTHTIEIMDWHPARVNQWDGRHWSARSKAKRIDRLIVAGNVGSVPRATGKRRVSLVIVLGPRQRGGDPDAYWKSTLDALVACGQLTDDRKECVELGSVTYERGPQKATRIILSEVQS